MAHPVELQRRNMIEYQQIDNQGNTLFKEDGTSKVPDYINNLFIEEYKEKIQAEQENNKKNVADAHGDMLICIAGAIIEHKIPLEIFSKHFQEKPFEIDDVIIIHSVEKILDRFQSAITFYEKAILLSNLWNGVIKEAKEQNFNIEGIYNAIAENNLARIDRDENGIPKTDANGKIMRKDMHPDLKPFVRIY